jgi:hypothetical protein
LQDPVLLARAALAAGDVASAQAIRGHLVQDSIPGANPADLAILDALIAAASGKVDNQVLDNLVARGASGGVKSSAQAASVLLASLGGRSTPRPAPSSPISSSASRPRRRRGCILLEDAGTAKRKGEAGLLALSIALDAGAAGPQPDRPRQHRPRPEPRRPVR